MKRYWGLQGSGLNAAIWGLSCFCIMIFGYNQAVAGGVLTTVSFQRQFPEMDTIDTKGAQQHHNATIQGRPYLCLIAVGQLADIVDRHCSS